VKVALNLEPKSGPFGGGNSFIANFVESLKESGHEVHFDLNTEGLDFIFILDPRWRHPLARFTIATVARYVIKNKKTLIIHRINECDERKNSHFMNQKLRLTNYIADSTIFVSSWLQSLNLVNQNQLKNRLRTDVVIKNGSDSRIFYPDKDNNWDGKEKLKLVTHHWSSNSMKGLDLYQCLDDFLRDPLISDRFEFTYIGNLPNEARFVNARVLPPLHGAELANELRKHHVYITGSINEPGGNHQNEGGLSGLPIIFLDSGSMSEYCDGYGIKIAIPQELPLALEKVSNNYNEFREQMFSFPNTAEKMAYEYMAHLQVLDEQRENLVRERNLLQNPWDFIRLQFPM
jgi:hypothetical protein